ELLRKAYFAGSRGVLAVADLTRRSTLDGVSGWIDAVGKVVMRVPVLIAVNKADLEANGEFGQEEIQKVAEGCGAEFLMTSALPRLGVIGRPEPTPDGFARPLANYKATSPP